MRSELATSTVSEAPRTRFPFREAGNSVFSCEFGFASLMILGHERPAWSVSSKCASFGPVSKLTALREADASNWLRWVGPAATTY